MSYKPTQETLTIVAKLGGKWSGDSAMARCPAHKDRTPSLKISQGENNILVWCYAGCNGSDVLTAIRQQTGASTASSRAKEEYRPRNTDIHRHIWSRGIDITGTLAERYLRDVRGIELTPPDILFHPRCPQGKKREGTYKELPALLVGIYRAHTLVAVQRIFLDPNTAQYTAKMIIGDNRGGLWPSTFPEPNIRIAEGFETAVAFSQITGIHAGAAFGNRNLPYFELPSNTKHVTLLPDNDQEGQTWTDKAIALRLDQGLLADAHPCPSRYGDWADILKPLP
jgi:Toprim domain